MAGFDTSPRPGRRGDRPFRGGMTNSPFESIGRVVSVEPSVAINTLPKRLTSGRLIREACETAVLALYLLLLNSSATRNRERT